MEISQGNLCLASLNKQKYHFYFNKNRGQQDKTDPVSGIAASERREDIRRGCIRVSMVQKLCAHVYVNGKMKPAQTVPGMGGREIKNGRGW
jgi:hypothetical protein